MFVLTIAALVLLGLGLIAAAILAITRRNVGMAIIATVLALILFVLLAWPGWARPILWPAAEATPAAPPALPNFTQQWEVPDGRWTPALTENLVIELAVQVRPNRPWEGSVGPVENQVYQFKTEYLDEDATTWQPGIHLYEFDLAAGWQPVFVGIQGDSPIQLCWMQENGALGAQLLMKTMKGNGTSALVFFTKTDKVPAAVCP